ncbi:class I SAM-dependent methyltransferase [Streptomonospora sp. S1-112]|uniref:Class I SAM-dependent methyltransferase n=1 Tax=Streptomonospora mangrovi TaxID=2883123 RepID=A0A9X3SCP0_9ACTN|nr:class I SAM-dependent methyltransferase [Streptomonospora mangrovi]MDA0562977.1 class I SAM-dependent methyltransferase [Streptomonospora mangrovi]
MSDRIDADFTGVESTMLITLYLRALETRSAEPVLNDPYAADLVDRIDVDFARLLPRGASGNRYTVAVRGRRFDDWAADFLARHPDAVVLHLGCGLDSRAFRLGPPPGVRWYDVDLPDVIALRDRLYPQRPEGYTALGASAAQPDWLAEIPADRPVLVVAEGLLMYLGEPDIRRLLGAVADRFPSGELLFDGFAPWVVGLTQRLAPLLDRRGLPHYTTATADGGVITRWDPRYRRLAAVPILDGLTRVSERGPRATYQALNAIPGFRNFYRLCRFAF